MIQANILSCMIMYIAINLTIIHRQMDIARGSVVMNAPLKLQSV